MSHFYLQSIRKTILQFLDIFNNITVAKYNSDGNITKVFTLPVKLASKEKSYMWALDQKNEKALPMLAVQLASISHDASRITNKNQEVYFDINTADGSYDYYTNPVPYNLDFMVTIIANYVVEIDQILEQILSFFNPYVFIRVKVSEYADQAFDLKVLFTGANPDHSTTLEETEYRMLSWTLSFTVQALMFKPSTSSESISGSLVEYVTRRYWWTEEDMNNNLTNESNTPSTSAGWMLTGITSAGGYDESGSLLVSYELFTRDD
jgi:hypothetical protein